MFNIKKDLIFFDIESTGLNVIKDRIVQIGFVKFTSSSKDPIEKEMLINPGIPISDEAMAVHGITPDMLKNKPTFSQVAQELFDFIGDADLAGYNSDRFDIPMLMEEFARVGLDFNMDDRKAIDVQKIFYKMEPRTLKAAYSFYCNETLEDAHDALVDVRATVAVLKGQLDKYDGVDYEDGDGFKTVAPIQNDVDALSSFTSDYRMLDATQRLKYGPNGVVVFNFGKHVGKPVAQTLANDKQYLSWILQKDFSIQVKKIVQKLVKEYEANPRNR
jgi:DNA polymerase-3 subunit epsilon